MKSLSFDGVCYAMYVCMKYVRDSYFQNRWQSSPSPKWSLQNAMASLMIGKNYTSSLSLLPFLQNRIKKKRRDKIWMTWITSQRVQYTRNKTSSVPHLTTMDSSIHHYLCNLFFSV